MDSLRLGGKKYTNYFKYFGFPQSAFDQVPNMFCCSGAWDYRLSFFRRNSKLAPHFPPGPIYERSNKQHSPLREGRKEGAAGPLRKLLNPSPLTSSSFLFAGDVDASKQAKNLGRRGQKKKGREMRNNNSR